MTVNCLLMPRANGVPTWHSKEVGELSTMKLPDQFRSILGEPKPLSEDIGENMARWAEGGPVSRFGEQVGVSPPHASVIVHLGPSAQDNFQREFSPIGRVLRGLKGT